MKEEVKEEADFIHRLCKTTSCEEQSWTGPYMGWPWFILTKTHKPNATLGSSFP